MKLEKICMYEGQVDLITGLAIKGSSNEIHIGGADSEVIKNPVTGEPYIPGSSLKGKMRSQLEKKMGKFRTRIAIASCNSFISDARWQMRLGFTDGGRSPTGEKPKRAATQAA